MKFIVAGFTLLLAASTSAFPMGPKYDYLLVVDDSRSFERLHSVVHRRFDGFVDRLYANGIDFKIAVVTTSCRDNCGEFQGPIPVINRYTPDASRRFVFNLRTALNSWGSERERGLDSALAALRGNPDFHRPDARLFIVAITDSDDFSEIRPPEFVREVNALARPPHRWQLDFLGNIDPYECRGPGGYVEVGYRYMDVQRRTGGLAAGLCSDRRMP